MEAQAGRPARAWAAVRDHPSAVLLVGQLVAVVVYPFFDQEAAGRAVLGAFGTALVLVAVAAVRPTPALTWVAVLLGAPAMALSVVEGVVGSSSAVVLASALLHGPFYFYVSFAMIRYLFHDDRVTRDELYATGAAFTVVAWGFTYWFAACQVIWPGSFASTGGPAQQSWFDLLFVSFSNLTSVGLSDILPVQPHARSLVMLEQVAGVFYVALVIARLVALATVGRRSRPGS